MNESLWALYTRLVVQIKHSLSATNWKHQEVFCLLPFENEARLRNI
jgi:hypothetical protein